MKRTLSNIPLMVLLLPVFFVLHGYAANTGFIRFGNTLPLYLSLITASVILYLLFRVLLKDAAKAGLFTVYCMGFYLFFGAIYDFLKAYSPIAFLWKYSVLLGLFLVIALVLFIWLRHTKKQLNRTMLFINLLLLIFIGVDLVTIAWTGKKNDTHSSGTNIIAAGTPKPNIYLLLFDEYSSSHALKEYYQFDNSGLDSFLTSQGFHLFPNSRSNYPETSFSMASCLNMDYLPWVKRGMEIKREHYQRCADEIRNNEVTRLLSSNGYEIVNQSIFNLKDHPTPVSQRWLHTDTRLITEETLLDRLCNEFGWFFSRYAWLRTILPVTSYEEQMQNNDKLLAAVLHGSTQKTATPRFIYGHFLLPHFPYYKDKDGNIYPDSIVHAVMAEKLPPLPKYLEYVQYANTEIKKLIMGIRQNDPQAVVIFLSDHGYRWTVPVKQFSHVFPNQNALYLPSGNYANFHDSLTNVNQFRILFNTLFNSKFPVLKDTSMPIQPETMPD
ncbi:MAG: sulfatase-like hydrolase/transferase [Chitinophagaceae bacterium]|nr:sulfatase-like hydrolase/transferase [Chitinophagaceae bacterium]